MIMLRLGRFQNSPLMFILPPLLILLCNRSNGSDHLIKRMEIDLPQTHTGWWFKHISSDASLGHSVGFGGLGWCRSQVGFVNLSSVCLFVERGINRLAATNSIMSIRENSYCGVGIGDVDESHREPKWMVCKLSEIKVNQIKIN